MREEYMSDYIVNRSYWERSVWPDHFNYICIGGGFTGLYTALALRQHHPQASICVLERGDFFGGASTRNAGFICFGSPSEILADLNYQGEKKTKETITARYEGMQRLRSIYQHEEIDMLWEGGCEIPVGRNHKELEFYLDRVNDLIEKATGIPKAYSWCEGQSKGLAVEQVLVTKHEGSLHPGKAIRSLLSECHQKNIDIYRGINVTSISPGRLIRIEGQKRQMTCDKLAVCTNAFTRDLLEIENMERARNDVFLTCPLPHQLRGTYHVEEGYVYFRGLEDRILIGGARHILKGDEPPTESLSKVTNYLKRVIHNYICPHSEIIFEDHWIGYIGVGEEKTPIVKKLDDNMAIGVRLSGMGVALAPQIGFQLAALLTDKE